MAANSTTTSGGSSITDNGSVIDATHQHPNITSFISGVSLPEHLHDATKSLQLARRDGFDYVVTALPNTVPLLSSSSSSNSNSVAKRSSNVVVQHHRTDVTRLESKWWSTSIVGMIVDPPHYNNTNNNIATTTNNNMNMGSALLAELTSTSTSLEARGKKQEANKIFWGMMEWASHMNIPAVILPPVPLFTTVDVENKDDDDDVNGTKSSIAKSKSDDEEDMFAAPSLKKESDDDDVMKMHQSKRGRTTHSPDTTLPTSSSAYTNSNNNNEHTNKISSINNPSAKEYARLISNLATSSICTSSNVQLWLRVPLTLDDLQSYQLLLSRCSNSSNVGCILYINTRIDKEATTLPSIVRSLHALIGGGHIKAISWNVNVFLTNKKGYPTLSKSHQYIFQLLYVTQY